MERGGGREGEIKLVDQEGMAVQKAVCKLLTYLLKLYKTRLSEHSSLRYKLSTIIF